MSEEIHSTQGIIPVRHFPALLAQAGSLPSLIVNAGETAAEKFLEFFTAQIRNRNTREAYARAVGQFMAWCEEQYGPLEPHRFSLKEVNRRLAKLMERGRYRA